MKNLVRIVLLVVLILLVVIRTRPDTFHVERGATVNAPAAAVYAQVADFHNWAAWSPWAKLDPKMVTSYDGPASGVGAFYHWVGNDKVGEGTMKVTGATPPSQVVIALEFLKPFKTSNTSTFTLTPEGAGTRVVWSMDGKNGFEAKAMSLFTNMDKMIGPDFERGLTQLRTASESAPAVADTTAPAAPTGMSVK